MRDTGTVARFRSVRIAPARTLTCRGEDNRSWAALPRSSVRYTGGHGQTGGTASVELTQILQRAESGSPEARASLIQAAYDDLRKLAARKMSDERQNHTLTSTALVHEVSMKLLSDNNVPLASRGQFFAYAATAMRNLLIDHARTRGRQKRGGDQQPLSLDEAMIACQEQRDEFLALNDALEALAQVEPRKSMVVEMKYFGGLSNPETASALGISVATVKRDWEVAKTWLYRELQR